MGQYCVGREKQIKDNQYTTQELLKTQQPLQQMTPPRKDSPSRHWSTRYYLSQTKSKNERVQDFMSSNKIQKESQQLYELYMAGDIVRLVGYLDINMTLARPLPVPHEWASPITTVSALATELLAELFEVDDDELPQEDTPLKVASYREQLMSTRFDVKVVMNLLRPQQDLVEWTLILLIILLQDEEQVQSYLAKSKLVNALTPLLNPAQNLHVRMYAFEILGHLIIGRIALLELFFRSATNRAYLLNFFQVKEIDLVFRAIYGLMLIIEDAQTVQHKHSIAQHLFFLRHSLIQTQEDFLFVTNFGSNESGDKRQYILTAIRRIVEFIDQHSPPDGFDSD